MAFERERLQLNVTYVAPGIVIGVRPASVEFLDKGAVSTAQVATLEGHIALPPAVTFYLNASEFVIGRSVSSDLCVDSPKISRSHIRISTTRDESYQVQDVGSANGTLINGQKMEKGVEYKLRESGELQLAGVFHVGFKDYGATFVAPESITLYGLTLSHGDRALNMQGRAEAGFRLANNEYKFLKLLMERYPEPASHLEITQQVWGYEPASADDDKRARDAIFNIVKRLRERLQELEPDHEYIETVRKWGDKEGGYRFHKQ